MARTKLKDIARACDVSIATVSLALNDKPCRLSDETRERIKRVAIEMDYIPNQVIRSLSYGQSNIVALIIPSLENRYFATFAARLEECCAADGKNLMVSTPGGIAGAEARLVNQYSNRGFDGIALAVTNEVNEDEGLIQAIAEAQAPVVMVDRAYKTVPCDKVHFNNENGGYMATKYLLEQGHVRIGCITDTRTTFAGRERYRGYLAAMAEGAHRIGSDSVVETPFTAEGGYAAMGKLLRTDVTAVLAMSDTLSLGALRYAHEHNVHVPRDISLMSYDNSYDGILFNPALTSIDQDVRELAARTYDILRGKWNNPDATCAEQILTPKLVIRGSVTSPSEQSGFRAF